MTLTTFLKDNYPKMAWWIGAGEDSPMNADIEALTTILPNLVKNKLEASEENADLMEEAIEAVAYTIANLRDVRKELTA